MDRDKTLNILKALAEGVDPHSGETFAADSPYQHADVVRALYAAITAIQSPAKTPSPRSTRGNAGKPWSKEEDAQLLEAFDQGASLELLAQQHGRSRLGVEARLARFDKIPAPAKILPSNRLDKLSESKGHDAR